MAKVNESFLSEDSSSEDEDGESFQNDFDSNRASYSEYGTNPASFSLSDFETNRLSFTSENDNPFSDQESTKEFSEFNSNNQHQSESNSEEEGRPYFQENELPVRTGPVTFYKYGQPTKVVHKSPPSCYSSKRLSQSCSDSEDQEDMPAKRSKFDDLAVPAKSDGHTSEKAKAMMEKMGYRKGEGLGKHSQGRVVPVEVSKQRGRRGLGLTLPGLEPADLDWDSSMEVVSIEEEVKWLKGGQLPPIDMATLLSWQQVGPRNLNIEEFSDFCDPNLLNNILIKKSIFDSLDGDEMRKARTRSNPFETIGKGMFLNRAAMKMANMDRVFDFMFTSPLNKKGEPMVPKDELLYFADVCAGPGGFSEYVLWRNKWRAKGFGFTLKGEHDFKLSDFFSGPCESFEPYYGVHDDGNVFDPANIESLMHFVMDHTQQIGVHFMMADGGFSVDGQENIQELLSKQLYLCQFLVALCIVRTGGHFVCKLFDIFSPFSVGLVYLMYRAFDRISIHKPNTSRPANSERYIICKWKREDCEPTREYLFNLNKELCRLGNKSKEDINYCVSMEQLLSDKIFIDYIVESNNVLGERQVVNLIKIAAFCRDVKLTEMRQADMRRECLAYWKIPDLARRVDKTTADELAIKRVQKSENINILRSPGTLLKNQDQLEKIIKSIYDWHAVPISNHKEICFYIGLGRNRVYRLTVGGVWRKAETGRSINLELSPGTMVYGELVQEVQGECKSQLKKPAFHIIDAISLGEENISHLHYTERLKMCELFALALHKSTRTDLYPLKAKKVYYLEDLDNFFGGLTVFLMKNGTQELLLCTEEVAFQPKGLMFIKATKDPWMRHVSRKTKHRYFAKPGAESMFDKDRPEDACSSTLECVNKRLLWVWEQGVGIHQELAEDGVLHKDQLMQFIRAKLSR